MLDAKQYSKERQESMLKEMRDLFDYDTQQWREIREQGQIDMRYVAGDPWDPKDRQARKDANRPCLALDELGQYVNQLINTVRQHKRAIQVTPVGNGANDQKARLRADLIRQIEYESNSQLAYTTGFENAVQRSYGFWRVRSKYVSERSRNQKLLIEPIVNPDLVTIDSDILMPDGSDMKRAWVAEWWHVKDFRKKFPKAKIHDFTNEIQTAAPKWIQGERIQLAEWWTLEYETATMRFYQTPDGQEVGLYADEAAQRPDLAQMQVVGEREAERTKVCQYLTNGVELLEKHEWPGKSIPLVCCFGKVLYVDEGSGSTKKILSLVRLARDPQMLYCYYRTAEAEQVGMSTKFPYFVRRGSLKSQEQNKLAESLHAPVAFITVESTADNVPPGQMPEMPVRNPFEPAIQALEVGAEGARRAIQAAMGISPLPTSAQRRNEKSGIALQEMRQAEQQGSFHFIDHYEASISRTGVLLDELIPHYYDNARDVTVRKPDDETAQVRINDPQSQDKDYGPIDVSEGDYDITLSTGPSYDSEREAASEFADSLAQNPQMMGVIGDLVVKLKNLGPIGDEISDRLKALLPPPVQQMLQAKEQSPAQLIQQFQQAMQQNELLQGEVQAKTRLIETEQVKADNDMKLEQMKQDFEMRRTQMEQDAKIEIEKAKIVADLLKARLTAEQNQTIAMMDQATKELDVEVAAAGEQEERQMGMLESDKQREHESGEAARGREFESEQGRENRAFEAEQAAQARQAESQSAAG